MPPMPQLILAIVSLMDAAIFAIMGKLSLEGKLPMQPRPWLSEAEEARRQRQNRAASLVIMRQSPLHAVAGIVLLVPMPIGPALGIFMVPMIWLLLVLIIALIAASREPQAADTSRPDRDLPIR
ncbi:MAG: hypothetical protein GEEBNDBF_02116 [bacterium]|nr:hypothetical protein [bacterium]